MTKTMMTNTTRMSHYKDKDNNHATQQSSNAQRSHVILVCVVKHGGRGVVRRDVAVKMWMWRAEIS